MDTLKTSDDRIGVLESWFSRTRRIDLPPECGKMYLTVNYDTVTGKLVQTHIHASRGASYCLKSNMEALSRMISKDLRGGATKVSIERELGGIRCGKVNGLRRPSDPLSCADGIAKALKLLPMTIDIEGDENDGVTDTREKEL